MNPETVAINFKNLGMKAHINKADFDPSKHKLWTDADEKRLKAPLPPVPNKEESATNAALPGIQPEAPARPAKTRKA